jgi:hypothetical protein
LEHQVFYGVSILILLLITITSCGYKPLFSKKGKVNYSITEYDLKGEKLINKKIKDFKIEDINFDDQKVFELLSSGNTVGLFQVESAGMREALLQMKPKVKCHIFLHVQMLIQAVGLWYKPKNNIS